MEFKDEIKKSSEIELKFTQKTVENMDLILRTLNQLSVGEVFYIPSSRDAFQNLGRFWAVNLRTNVLTQLSPFSVVQRNNFRSNLNYLMIKIKRKFKSLMRFLRLTV